MIDVARPTFYPVKIPRPHRQLKKHISTSDADLIYYTSECTVWVLHKGTGKRRLIASLEFPPTCLDARYGWVCVGALDDGNCAFINVSAGEDEFGNHNDGSSAEVDALLPLDLDPESRLLATISGQSEARPIPRSHSSPDPVIPRRRRTTFGFSREPVVHRVTCGEDIVNSVTIHRIHSNQKDCKNEDVVLVTNNDKTIRIYSLSQMCHLTTIYFDCAMNHASISPSDDLMIAAGDEPRVFFCQRRQLSRNDNDTKNPYIKYVWDMIAEPEMSLAHQKHFLGDLGPGIEVNERVDTCFATAFSPSGHLCAAASQTGIITVFDTSLIRPNMDMLDGVIDIFKTSRPVAITNFSGAVRAMSFSPAPWDLLAWAEDRGRVCVVDVRPGPLRSKQVLALDVNSPDLNTLSTPEAELDDLTAEGRQLEIEARFLMRQREALDAQRRLAAVSNAADQMEMSAERRRIMQETRIDSPRPSDEDFHAFTEDEERMLEEIRQYRLHEVTQTQGDSEQAGPYSIDYLGTARNQIPNIRARDLVPDLHFRNNTANTRSSLNPIPRSTDSIRDWINHRSIREQSRTENRREPRRRSSVVISNSNDPSRTTSSHPSSLAPIGTLPSNLSASPSRLASYTPPSPPLEPNITDLNSEPWNVISDAMISGTYNPTRNSPSRNTRPQDPTTSVTTSTTAQPQSSATPARTRREPTSERSLASLRSTIDNPITPPLDNDYDRSLAALRAQQDRSLQQLRDHQAQLASYQARYERLRSVNAADMRRLEQTYLERSSTSRAGIDDVPSSETPDEEQLALIRRLADPNRYIGNSESRNLNRLDTAIPGSGLTRSNALRGTGSLGRLTRRIIVHDLRGEEDDGPVTMGLGWDPDGGRLYVGTEEGILAYEVNKKGRMQFPAVEWL